MKQVQNLKGQGIRSEQLRYQQINQVSQIVMDKTSSSFIYKIPKRKINDPFMQIIEGSKNPKIKPTHVGRRFLLTNEKRKNSQIGDSNRQLQDNRLLQQYIEVNNNKLYKFTQENVHKNDVHIMVNSPKDQAIYQSKMPSGLVSPRQRYLVQAGNQFINELSPKQRILVYNNLIYQTNNIKFLNKQNPTQEKEYPDIIQKPKTFVGTFRANKYKRVQSANRNTQQSRKGIQSNSKNVIKNVSNSYHQGQSIKKIRSLTPQPAVGFNFPLENGKTEINKLRDSITKQQLFKPFQESSDYLQTSRQNEHSALERFSQQKENKFRTYEEKPFENRTNQYCPERQCKTPQLGTKMNQIPQLKQKKSKLDNIEQSIYFLQQNTDNDTQLEESIRYQTVDSNNAFDLSFSQDIEQISIAPSVKKKQEQEVSNNN